MKNIYCLSGLGADQRIFVRTEIEGARLIHLPWVAFDKHDEMACYAQKMAAQIDEENPLILGLSFGGMLATEIALQRPVRHVFLVSSAKGKHELPDVNGTIKYLIQHDLIPYGLFTQPNKILYNQFGADTPGAKEMLNNIMKDTDPDFLGWAFKAILNWQNARVPSNITHIHGTADKVLKPAFITADYWLNGGTHMMIYNRAPEVNRLLSDTLQRLS